MRQKRVCALIRLISLLGRERAQVGLGAQADEGPRSGSTA